MKGAPFLVMGNKIDKIDAVHELELARALGIAKMTPEDAASVPAGERLRFACSCAL